MTLQGIVDFATKNYELLVVIQQGLCSALSGVFALLGWTRASKVVGTVAALDLGRLVRYAKLGLDAKKALAAASKGAIVLLAVACSGSPQTIPTVCPIPSQYLVALPPPAAVASAVQAAQGVVEQAKDVAQDPDAAAAVLVAAKALDTAEPLCPSLEAVASADCTSKVAEARAILAKTDATREQVCAAAKLAVLLAQVAEDSAPIVAFERACR